MRLPRAHPLASGRFAHAALLALTALFALIAVAYTFPVGDTLKNTVDDGIYDNVVLAAGLLCVARGIAQRRDRTAWIAMGVAVLAWGVGDYVWTFTVADLPDPPYPSVADIGFLAVYPAAYVAIVLLLRSHVQELRTSLWLDGVISGLAVAAVGCAIVLPAVLETVGGSRAAVTTNIAYPLADLTLIALVVWALAVTGWRPGRAWGLVALGILVFSVSDCLYLYQTALGTYETSTPTDLGWVAGCVLIAWAAWQPRANYGETVIEGWLLLSAPVVFGLLGLAVLLVDHIHRVNALALALASLSILGVIARMAMTFAENLRMLARTQHEAHTDVLTGLGNRRRLLIDLERKIEHREKVTLALFDLNGFKPYNDVFGHPAGDALLSRLGDNLARFVTHRGAAYRMGGDEFCILFDNADESVEFVVAGAERALREQGVGFSISASFGAVTLPDEATTLSDALGLADQRMYAKKNENRPAVAGERSSSVLMAAIAERPKHSEYTAGVVELAEVLANKLGLAESEVSRVRLTAELHDVGKMAIPDAILHKPGPLSDEEWAFVRGHTVIAERILLAAPALAHVAGVVRSSREHFDGSGYPDGLAGTDIPLVSRIVFVCDAFEAMTAERPYRPALTIGAALAELERCAGTQFDPMVVAAFAELLAERGSPRIALASA
jgi:two-component system, cell cycle response regulator